MGSCLSLLLSSSREYSASERRVLAGPPELSGPDLRSGEYMAQAERFAMDQFPLRDALRGMKTAANLYLFQKQDDRGLYRMDGHISKMEYPLDQRRLNQNIDLLRDLYNRNLVGTDSKIYLSLIPDKHYWLGPQGGYPTMDYELLTATVKNGLPFAEYVDIFGLLTADSYYRTDPHWRQETLLPVAKKLAASMGASIDAELHEASLDTPFYGAYCGQLALPVKPDELRYLTGPELEACTITCYDGRKTERSTMFDLKKAEGRDPYEMFLCGSAALVTVENPNGNTGRELLLFRDSFASSLAPLLAPGYSKITLIDLRYIRLDQLADFVDFHGQDVLLLYSTLMLNQGLGA